MQHHVEVAVIGAGVVGLAIARALSMKGKEVLVLERASAIGTGKLNFSRFCADCLLALP